MSRERVEGAGAAPAASVDGGRRPPGEAAAAGLIAQRLRETAAALAPPPAELISPHAVERWLAGDAGHLHRAGDLRTAPISSHRGVIGPAVVALKRTLRRLLHPLIDIQSGVNLANARVDTFLLEQLAVQARCIDELQQQVAELLAERGVDAAHRRRARCRPEHRVKILVASTFVPFVEGGSQMIVRDLAEAVRRRGHDVDVISIPASSAWDRVLEETLAIRLLEVGRGSDALIAIRPPSYALRHPSKRVWFIHHHRNAYDLWGTRWQDYPPGPAGLAVRDAVRRADDLYLGEAERIFANSRTVAERLRRFNGIEAGVLYPPLGHPERCYWEAPEDYVVYPSRIASHKRQALAVEAAAHLRTDARIVIAGAPGHQGALDELTRMIRERGLERRVTLTPRWISEAEKAELIARSLGVLYVPYDEDSYGYVSLEASHAGKAVITCSDSGGALELIRDGENGLVTAPDARSLAAAIDRLREDPAWANALGARAREVLAEMRIDWDRVLDGLLA